MGTYPGIVQENYYQTIDVRRRGEKG